MCRFYWLLKDLHWLEFFFWRLHWFLDCMHCVQFFFKRIYLFGYLRDLTQDLLCRYNKLLNLYSLPKILWNTFMIYIIDLSLIGQYAFFWMYNTTKLWCYRVCSRFLLLSHDIVGLNETLCFVLSVPIFTNMRCPLRLFNLLKSRIELFSSGQLLQKWLICHILKNEWFFKNSCFSKCCNTTVFAHFAYCTNHARNRGLLFGLV